MANAFYKSGIDAILKGNISWLASNTSMKVIAVDLAQYTPNFNTNANLSDIPAGARYGTPATLVLTDAAAGVGGASGFSITGIASNCPTLEAVVIYKDTGNAATSTLFMYIDTTDDASLPTSANISQLDIALVTGRIFTLA